MICNERDRNRYSAFQRFVSYDSKHNSKYNFEMNRIQRLVSYKYSSKHKSSDYMNHVWFAMNRVKDLCHMILNIIHES